MTFATRPKILHKRLNAGKDYRNGACGLSSYELLQPFLFIYAFKAAQTNVMRRGAGVVKVPRNDHGLRYSDGYQLFSPLFE
jgi:hypothetical protein